MMPDAYDDTEAGRRKALIENPHIAVFYFGDRVEAFTSAFFDGILDAEWKWFGHEYQGRGNTHTHGCVKLGNDPGIVDLTCKAYAGVKATAQLEAAVGLAVG